MYNRSAYNTTAYNRLAGIGIYGQANLQATATLSTIGAGIYAGISPLSAQALTTTQGYGVYAGNTLLSGIADLTSIGIIGKYGASTLETLATLSPAGALVGAGQGTSQALASLEASGVLVRLGAASLSALAMLSANLIFWIEGAILVTVSGQRVETLVGNFTIEDRIQERSIARFAVRDDEGAKVFQRGQPVQVKNKDNEKLFTGFIDSASEVVIPGGTAKIHSISCTDNHYLADKRVVAKVYFNRTAGYIVNDLITTYLAEEGIMAGTIEDGPTFTNTVFSYISVSQAIGSLAEKSGNFWWYIDLDRKLHFRPFAALPAPWMASASDMKEGSISLDHGNPKYRNRQIVTGIKEITDPQVEYHKGDGHAQSFTVGYPIHSVPTVKVNGVTKTIGIKGLDTGKDWYWSKGDLVITQDTMGTVLTDTDTLEIDYIGEFDAVIISTDYGAVEKQKAVEGVGTGYVEDVVDEPGTQDKDAAFLTASMLLAKYATDGRHLKFATRRSGLAPGQLLIVNLPDYGLNNVEMLIESVITDEQEGVVYYHIVAAEGPEQGSWTRFFATMAQMIQAGPTDVSTATILIIPVNIAETWDWTETTNVTVYACPILPFTLPFTLC